MSTIIRVFNELRIMSPVSYHFSCLGIAFVIAAGILSMLSILR